MTNCTKEIKTPKEPFDVEKFLQRWNESGEMKTSLYWRLLNDLVKGDQ